MAITFSELWEAMDNSPLMDSGESNKADGIIRAGLDLRKDDEQSFWEDFMNLCGNSEGLAELLDVRPEQVSSWPEKIREHLDNIDHQDSESPTNAEDREMLPTGDTGAVEMPDNMDPFLGELE